MNNEEWRLNKDRRNGRNDKESMNNEDWRLNKDRRIGRN
jgi:hypothetical protein